MSDKREQEIDVEIVKKVSQAAIEKGDNIRNDVRDLTLKALSERHLDVKKTKEVIHSVIDGASIGAAAKGDQVKDKLKDTMAGIDDALAKSAEASKLAIEEAAGHVKDFSRHDLKRALDDLLTLEELFFSTAHDVAKGASETIKETLSDLINHSKNTGTNVGETAVEAVKILNQKLENTLKDTVSSGAHATLEVGAHIAIAASGILEGIAKSLLSENKTKSDKD